MDLTSGGADVRAVDVVVFVIVIVFVIVVVLPCCQYSTNARTRNSSKIVGHCHRPGLSASQQGRPRVCLLVRPSFCPTSRRPLPHDIRALVLTAARRTQSRATCSSGAGHPRAGCASRLDSLHAGSWNRCVGDVQIRRCQVRRVIAERPMRVPHKRNFTGPL